MPYLISEEEKLHILHIFLYSQIYILYFGTLVSCKLVKRLVSVKKPQVPLDEKTKQKVI